MNAKELQIGDLVDYRGKVIEVTSLYAKNGSNEVGFGDKEDIWVNGCVLNPIPLTPEILERLGFEWRAYAVCLSGEDICLVQCGDYWRAKPHQMSNDTICRIQYVHELQHLLRLCGIDKEITL